MRATTPTAEQHAWLRKNPGYIRTSHVRNAKFSKRGTLRADGTFIPESGKIPIMDGNGGFGVGILQAKRRR
jgi:hypothetical protein